MEHRVAAYLGRQSKNTLFGKDALSSSESKFTLPIKPGLCEYCARPAIYMCSLCTCWYCTTECQKLHRNLAHRKICIPQQLTFQNGVPVYMNQTLPSELQNREDKHHENGRASVAPKKLNE